MYKPSSLIASITLTAFFHAQISSVWALSTGIPEQQHTPILLYLNNDPYTQALLRLQYDDINNTLEWQLLNNGLVLTNQSHALPEATQSVDSVAIYGGDLIIVAGRTNSQNWFIRALNSQGEFQWQRSGEGRVYDLAFSDDGKTLYSVGRSVSAPLFMVVDADSGVVQFRAEGSHDDKDFIYKQLVVSGQEEVIIALHNEKSANLRLTKWRTTFDVPVNGSKWIIDSQFCTHCGDKKVRAVALQHDRTKSRFYLVNSDSNQLEFSANNIKTGQKITTHSIPMPTVPVTWDRVVHIDSSLPPGKTFPVPLSTDDKTLFIANDGCHIFVATSDNPGLPLINLCNQPEQHHLGRKLLQNSDNSSSEAQEIPFSEQRAFMNLEWVLGAFGIIEVTLLASGIFGIGWGVRNFFKEKNVEREERIAEAKNREKLRRAHERQRLHSFRKYNPLQDLFSTMSFFMSENGGMSHMELEGFIVPSKDDEKKSISLTAKQIPKKVDSEVLETFVKKLKGVEELFTAARNMNIREVERLLKLNSEYINFVDCNGNTILHFAVFMRSKSDSTGKTTKEFIRHLIAMGARIEAINSAGLSPLILSALMGNRAAFEEMIHSPNISFESRSLLFHMISRSELSNGIPYFNEMLVRNMHKGINFRRPCNDKEWLYCSGKSSLSEGGLTILHEAAITGSYDMMELMIKYDLVNIDEADDEGNTALHYAVLHDLNPGYGAVKFLLYEGADPTVRNTVGITPMDNAEYRGIEEIKRSLRTPQRKHGQEKFVLDIELQTTSRQN